MQCIILELNASHRTDLHRLWARGKHLSGFSLVLRLIFNISQQFLRFHLLYRPSPPGTGGRQRHSACILPLRVRPARVPFGDPRCGKDYLLLLDRLVQRRCRTCRLFCVVKVTLFMESHFERGSPGSRHDPELRSLSTLITNVKGSRAACVHSKCLRGTLHVIAARCIGLPLSGR